MSLDFNFSDEELTALEAETANPYLADPAKGLQLITRLIAQPENSLHSLQRQHFKHLHDLIHQSYVSLSARDTCPTEALNYRDLIALEDALEDLVAFPDLANKTVVGIGGGFSAGKSRFINTLLNNDLLPEALEPTTAIPSYLVSGTHEVIRALNQFDHDVELDRSALQAITHAFPRHYRQAHGVEVGFAHMVRLLMIHDPHLPWQNIAFLDTPGYSKPDHPQSAQADRQIALRQLKEADQILWLLNAKNGSIRRDDIEFLRDLNHPTPIFFVVTQADLVGKSRIAAILKSTAEALEEAHIPSAGLMAWAAPLGSNRGQHWAGDEVYEWLTWMNGTVKETQTRVECIRILDTHIHYNSKALAENRELLSTLNELLPLAGEAGDSLSAEKQEKALELIKKSRTTIAKLKSESQAKHKDNNPGSMWWQVSQSWAPANDTSSGAEKKLSRSLASCLNNFDELESLLTYASGSHENPKITLLTRHIVRLRQEQRQFKELIDDFGGLKEKMLKTITLLVGDVVDDREVRHGHELIHSMKRDWFKRPLVQGESFDVRVVAVKPEEKKVVVVLGDDLASTGLSFGRIRGGLRIDPHILVKGSVLRAEVHAQEGESVTLVIRNPFAEN